MTLRGTLVTVMAAGTLTVAGSTGVAHAASQSVTQDCMSNITISVTLEVGDTLTINTDPSGFCSNAGTSTGFGALPQGVGVATYGATGTEANLPYNAGTAAFSYGTRIIYSATAVGSIRIQMENDVTMSEITYYDITVTAAGGHGSTGPTRLSELPLGDALQQVGVPTDGCGSVMDATLNWAGVPSGGWSESWAAWANAGLGGKVCTRSLTHASTGWRVSA